jgi:DNA mismatch repair protein MutS
MLQQYFRLKEEHPGVLMAMRVGDFYEFYGEDAETAARTLEITLTGREDQGTRIPMAGVPFHSVEKYLARLIQAGLKVAICDQLEDPKQAKGLVKRGVTRVLTPGTLVEDSMLQSGQNNFLAAICVIEGKIGLAILDPSTGEFAVTELGSSESEDRLLAELARLRPSELLVAPKAEGYGELARQGIGTSVTEHQAPPSDRAARKLMETLHVANLEGFGCADKPSAVVAASMVLQYAERNGLPLSHIESLTTYSVDGFLRIDHSTRRSLELTQNLQDGSKRFTLLSVLDQTKTPMGSRLMRKWIEQPLLDRQAIELRLDAVARLKGAGMARGDLRDELAKMSDIERLVARCATGQASPRDLAALRNTLAALPKMSIVLAKVSFGRIQELKNLMVDHGDLWMTLDAALVADPPHTVREGGLIKAGFNLELDKLRDLGKSGKSYIAALEQTERERTGINNLKVGFNSVFGYFIEITKSQIDKAPDHYIRKQTTANAERYITAELKEHESQVLGAEEKATALETELFHRLRVRVAEQAKSLLQTAQAVAELDVLASLAEVAQYRAYCRPTLRDDPALTIRSGRHPVVEAANAMFVPNDAEFGGDVSTQVMILTGPNMSGKSTYLRQTALIALMAQMGSFVPAESCEVGLCDRIFARIGAKDELALGQSTFMVEMIESANILNHATERSLVILDEVGRGTSTFDGMAIAWAMIEHLAEIRCRTLFATHYHQLNALAEQLPNVSNFRVAVEEVGSDIVWTHRVLPGGTDQSYGIHVARMAGVPPIVLARAREILDELESTSQSPEATPARTERLQLTLFEMEKPEVVEELEKLNVNQLTPLQALALLDEWKRKWGR